MAWRTRAGEPQGALAGRQRRKSRAWGGPGLAGRKPVLHGPPAKPRSENAIGLAPLLRSLTGVALGAGGAIVGVDVGATTISGGLVRGDGTVVSVRESPTRREGPGRAVETLLRLVDDLVTEAHARRLELIGVGVGLPGAVDAGSGTMRNDDNHVPEFARVPLAGCL